MASPPPPPGKKDGLSAMREGPKSPGRVRAGSMGKSPNKTDARSSTVKNPFKKKKAKAVFCPICDLKYEKETDVIEHLNKQHDVDMMGAIPTSDEEDEMPLVPPVRADSRLLTDLVKEISHPEEIEQEWVLLDEELRERLVQVPKVQRRPGHQVADQALWEQVMVDPTSKQWKKDVMPLLRRGVPPEMVRFLFLALTGAQKEMAKLGGNKWFRGAYQATFPGELPRQFFNLPLFGAPSFPSANLSDSIVLAGKRMLCVVAHHFPEFPFCPVLVHILYLALQCLTEMECLATCFTLLRKKEKLLKRVDKQPVTLIATTKNALTEVATVLHKFVLVNLKLEDRFARMDVGPNDYAVHWMASFFEGLPTPYRTHALLLWATDGVSAVLRIGIALMSLAVQTKTEDKEEFLTFLDWMMMGMTDDSWNLVLSSAYKYSNWTLRDAKVRSIAASAPSLELAFVHQRQYFRPKAVGSVVPRDELWEYLWGLIPERFRQNHPKVIFSTQQGWSWKLLLAAVVDKPAIMLIWKTKESGDVFGAVLVKGFVKGSENKYLPDREACVFNLTHCKSYHWNFGNPDYVSYWSADRICVGCDEQGRNCIVLDDDLEKIQLDACAVFKSPPLCGEDDRRPAIAMLEVYKF